jgi:hypothetical protein
VTQRRGERAQDTLEGWLAARGEAAPASLRPRLFAAVAAVQPPDAGSLADRSCRAGETLLAKLLVEGCASRSAAPDLLSADALVTYAFEAAAEDEGESAASIERRAAAAMARIAALGEGSAA